MNHLVNPLSREEIFDMQCRLMFQCPLTGQRHNMNAEGDDPHAPPVEEPLSQRKPDTRVKRKYTRRAKPATNTKETS